MKKIDRRIRLAAGVVIFIMAGIIYSWSIMSRTISASRDWSTSSLSLTFTIVMICFFLGNIICGFLSRKIKPRFFVIISAILFFSGFMTAAQTASSPVTLYIGIGVLCGFGSGLAYNAVMGTICAHFPERPGLISGVLLMGFGLSSFINGKIFAAAAPADGSDTWKTVYMVLAVVYLAVLVLCSLFIEKPAENAADDTPSSKKQEQVSGAEISTSKMLHNPSFWLFYIWVTMASAIGLTLSGQASGFASQVGTGVSDGMIATVVGLISVVNGPSRAVFGQIYDKIGYKKSMITDIVMSAVSISVLLTALFLNSFVLIIAGFVLSGFSNAAVSPVQSALIREFYGGKYYSANLSVLLSNLIISSFAQTLSGRLYDVSGSYVSTVMMMFIMLIVEILVLPGIKKPGEIRKTEHKIGKYHEEFQG